MNQAAVDMYPTKQINNDRWLRPQISEVSELHICPFSTTNENPD